MTEFQAILTTAILGILLAVVSMYEPRTTFGKILYVAFILPFALVVLGGILYILMTTN